MTTVYIYLAEATFRGTGDFTWSSPNIGDRHKVLLFMSQQSNGLEEDAALRELSRFGFADILITVGKPIFVESLNEPKMQAFQKYYEEALAEGTSVVWYPDVLPQPA